MDRSSLAYSVLHNLASVRVPSHLYRWPQARTLLLTIWPRMLRAFASSPHPTPSFSTISRLTHPISPITASPPPSPPLHPTHPNPHHITSHHTKPHHSKPRHASPLLSAPYHTAPHHSTPLLSSPRHSTPPPIRPCQVVYNGEPALDQNGLLVDMVIQVRTYPRCTYILLPISRPANAGNRPP